MWVIRMKNNNGEIICLLARREYQNNKVRNGILVSAVAIAVMTVFCVTSLVVGKVEADYLMYVRNEGTAASVILKEADEEQYLRIQSLSYIKAVGKELEFGNTGHFQCVVLDEVAWRQMQSPAYSDIHGSYPEEREEVMLSCFTLEGMGIHQPELGMEILLEINAGKGEETFRLSGYYTDYVDEARREPQGYFSKRYLEEAELPSNTRMKLLICQDDGLIGTKVEDMLYRDVEMNDKSQQFIGGNSMSLEAVKNLAGGYDTAVLFCMVLFGAVWSLVYNVLHISHEQDVRSYGIMKILGMTKRQIRGVFYRQILRITVMGCLVGAAAGMTLTVTVLPEILAKMSLYELGKASALIAFRGWILAGAIVFGFVVTFFSGVPVIWRLARLSSIESVKYARSDTPYRTRFAHVCRNHLPKTFSPIQMAWENVARFKRRDFLPMISLALGICVSIGGGVISKGTDYTNRIDYENHDFTIISNMSVYVIDMYPDVDEIFPSKLVMKLSGLDGIKEVSSVIGGFGKIRTDEEILRLRAEDLTDLEEMEGGFYDFVVQSVGEGYLEELSDFAEQKGLPLDMESVLDGTGAIMLHRNIFSKQEEEEGKDYVGVPFWVYTMNEEQVGDMSFSGYLNFDEEGFPKLDTTWNSTNVVYFLVSEKGLEHMRIKPQTFSLSFEVEPVRESVIKASLNQMVEEYNAQFRPEEPQPFYVTDNRSLSLTAKSDLLQKEKEYIASSRVVMAAGFLMLLVMGVANYFNVMVTNFSLRKWEFAVMESVGMSRAQLRRVIFWEGILYGSMIGILTFVFGSALWHGVAVVMKRRLAYFCYEYPMAALLAALVVLYVNCIIVPQFVYKKGIHGSLAVRLKR